MIDIALLITAMIMVESSNGRVLVGDKGRAIGYLHIHQIYVRDVNEILASRGDKYKFKYKDRWNKKKSIAMAVIYLRHYCEQYEKDTGKEATSEIAAKIHNSGPKGYKKDCSIAYWEKVKVILEKHREKRRIQND